jgi:hypothetical protein
MTAADTNEHDGPEAARPEPPAPPGHDGQAEAYVIPRDLAQATVDYLASRPYREVFGLVHGFEALEPLEKRADA